MGQRLGVWVGAIPRGCPAAVPPLMGQRLGDQPDAIANMFPQYM
ncbi:MAG TPA: hypothetical protein VKY19_06795 [Ktedonosporobacter sp.]|nr:hypothetical protein [Ktedonosporobacter sp.]